MLTGINRILVKSNERLDDPEINSAYFLDDTESLFDKNYCIYSAKKKGAAKDGIFFPDPWAKDGKTNPVDLQPLWNLVASKVQTHATS